MVIKTIFLPFDIKISKLSNGANKKLRQSLVSTIIKRDYNKIFCIGFGKTGTTSLEKVLVAFGFSVGDQAVAEMLAEDWGIHKRADRIIRYCHTADAFQDMPFMFPGLYKELDRAFPNSKFILSVRDNPDQWFGSLKAFHTNKFSSDRNRTPNEEDLKNAFYRYKGFLFDFAKYFWNYPQIPLYDEKTYKKRYDDHIMEVNEYFKGRGNLIQLNVALNEDFTRLCDFLKIETELKGFPWENKT